MEAAAALRWCLGLGPGLLFLREQLGGDRHVDPRGVGVVELLDQAHLRARFRAARARVPSLARARVGALGVIHEHDRVGARELADEAAALRASVTAAPTSASSSTISPWIGPPSASMSNKGAQPRAVASMAGSQSNRPPASAASDATTS